MSYSELKKLETRVQKAILSVEDKRKKEALAAVQKTAKEFGYSNLSDIVGGMSENRKPQKKRKSGTTKTSTPKYANPQNPSQTWTGKGRKPNWFIEATSRGVAASEMEIS